MGIDPATPAPGARRHRYRDLFVHAPVAYLVTDPDGTIRAANRLAARLLGAAPRALVGRPLRRFVASGDAWILAGRALPSSGLQGRRDYDLRLLARQRPPVPVRATVDVARDRGGRVRELRWLLRERPPTGERREGPAAAAVAVAEGGPFPRPRGGRREDLAGALEDAVAAAAVLLHADGAGLTLCYEDGGHRWVTATGSDALGFEEAQRGLGEGPYLDAIRLDEPVWSADLSGDQRWPRLGELAPASIRGVLAAPVGAAGSPVGACAVLTAAPRRWQRADAVALRAYTAVLARLLVASSEASRTLELADQLQQALDRRVLIEQAKGMVMAKLELGAEQAFALIRREARSRNRRVAEVAAEVIAGHLPPRAGADPTGGAEPRA
jgi:PAS domain S-box-containing protein